MIAELESTGREAYTGAIGFASPLAGLELSVAIRTFEVRGARIWLGAGGGIVADSDGEEEAREAAAKAAPLLAAIGAQPPAAAPGRRGRPPPARRPARAEADAAARSRGGALRDDPRRRRAAAGPRRAPRAARGEPRALYGLAPPADLAERAAAAARGPRARTAADRLVPGEDATVAVTALGALEPARLRPVVLPGGLGPHKWRDRTLLEAHEADDPATIPLLLDADGLVLEASRASIVVRAADGVLYTPPTTAASCPGSPPPGPARARGRSRSPTSTRAEVVYVASALRGLAPVDPI